MDTAWTEALPFALHPRYKTVYAEPTIDATRAFLTDLRARVEEAEKAVFALASAYGFTGFMAPERGGWPTTFAFAEKTTHAAFKTLRRKGRPMAVIANTPEGRALEALLRAGPAHPHVDQELRQALNLPTALRYVSGEVNGMTSIAGLLDATINWTPRRQFVFFVNPLHAYGAQREAHPEAVFSFHDQDDTPYPDPSDWRPAAGWDLLTSAKVDVIFAQAKADQEGEAA